MVYCGKPSKACHICREKKTRCDARPEGCGQCAKVGRKCPGYRNQNDLLFRDESVNVIKKARAKESRAQRAALSRQEPAGPVDEDSDEADYVFTLVERSRLEPGGPGGHRLTQMFRSLGPGVDDKAFCFFISNYVFDIVGPSRGHLEGILRLYKTGQVDDTVATSIKAVGLAGLALKSRVPSLAVEARKQYLKAIQSTNVALKSADDALKDSTLMAIQILGLFEIVAGTNQRSFQSWSEHVKGASTLICLRGINQLYEESGQRLFVQAATSLLTCCMQRRMKMPAHITEMARVLYEDVPSKGGTVAGGLALRSFQLMIEFTNFTADIGNGVISDHNEIMATSLDIDARLEEVFEILPVSWGYTTVYTDERPDIIYNGRYDVYLDAWVANLWNGMRIIRIILHEAVRKILLKGFSAQPPIYRLPRHTAQFQTSTDLIFKTQDDILSSIPQHVGYVRKVETDNPDAVPQYKLIDPPSAPAFAGYYVMWPLWFASIIDFTNQKIRDYAVRHLQTIGSEMGIRQALVLAGVVQNETHIFDWDPESASKP